MEPDKPTIFSFAAFVYDAQNRRLTRSKTRIHINKQMLDLLDLLVRSGGQLVTREQIQTSLWPDQFLDNRDKQITNAVSRLRHILGDNSTRPRYIESVPRTGYRLIPRVSIVESTPEPAEPISAAVPSGLDAVEAPTPPGQLPAPPLISSPDPLPLAESPQPAAGSQPRPPRLRARTAFLAAAVLLLLAGVFGAWRHFLHRAAAPPAEISLGIAPFHAVGPGAADLAQSFRFDLTDTLAQLPHVNVRASNSLDLVNLDQATFRDQATRLGLDVLILGSFTLEDNQCHVELELVRGKDLSHIASFDRTVSRFELASLRTLIRNEVYNSLKLAPGSGSLPGAPAGGTSDPRAYDAYLRASYHYSLLSHDSLPLAVSEYNEALAADPQFANAYAGLSRTYVYLVQNDLIGEKVGYGLASDAARHALALDSQSAEAHAVLGFIYFLRDWNLSGGESQFQQAIASNPNDPFYHQGLALIYCDQGRFREAEAEIDRAHVVDPFWVSSYITDVHIASVAGDRLRVQAAIQKIMQLAPGSAHARDGIGNAEWNLGLYTDAIATWREMAVIEKDAGRIALEDRGLAEFRRGGVPAYARVRLDAIHSGMKTAPHGNDFFPPEWYAQANQTDEALKAIRASIATHDGSVPGMAVVPAYRSLYANPEFQSIIAGIGLRIPARLGN